MESNGSDIVNEWRERKRGRERGRESKKQDFRP